ncbi:hypothetical protein CDD80_4808 [Ophiocordyceps camponoti-rufipedis]|uniref:Uncharacterized protein n=1 Tax=Ophiocordyceps camponoti-rufipedis TaxID=2004952 RepID=A0A2C5YXI6_9HYPO|nr:hypothetical protein CDD80_4808 [Ophiocordyceps camponoti-rufipedis]
MPSDHHLVILDCCAAGLAHLEQTEVEVLGASAWESQSSASPDASFTNALIGAIEGAQGDPITTTRLMAKMLSMESVRQGMSMPVHKLAAEKRSPALIHRIQRSPSPAAALAESPPPKHAHVVITVKVAKSDTVPVARDWAEWLTTNLPPYVGHIDIRANWTTGSSTVLVVLPYEIWLALPDKRAYQFLCYDFEWDVEKTKRRHAAILAGRVRGYSNPRSPGHKSRSSEEPKK